MTDEYKEDTEEIVPMPEYGLPTEATPLPEASQLEIKANEDEQEDTRLLSSEEDKRNSEQAKKLRERNKLESVRMLLNKARKADDNSSREYKGDHVYVWFSRNSKGEWELDHTYPESLKTSLEKRAKFDLRTLSVKDAEAIYGGKRFKQFAYFGPYEDRQKNYSIMLVNKYSLTPLEGKEEDNWELCKAKMIKEGIYDEELAKEIEKRREEKRKQESNQLTQRTPLRFSQKQ